jgi:hypothetical protein
MSMERVRLGGHDAVRLDAGGLAVVVTVSVGPRILGLMVPDGRNVLVESPGATLPCPGSGDFQLLGGHRLWAAPEVPRVTYRPDDDPVEVEELNDGTRFATAPDPVAGTRRDMTVRILGPSRLAIEHRVTNTADRPQRLAPWAITMLPPGGRAWLPLLRKPFDEGGFQAQRNIVLWPYARLGDPRLVLGDALIEVRTHTPELAAAGGKVKVGTSGRRGWLAHWRDGLLFVKRASHDDSAAYADLGASAQVYASRSVTEFETLGPLADLAPGGSAVHHEEWEVSHVPEDEAVSLVTGDALDRAG